MRILVTARDRKVAEDEARKRWPPAAGAYKRSHWLSGDDRVHVGIFGEDLKGAQYDLILVCQQKHLPPAYSHYLTWRLSTATGARFDRAD